MTFLALSSQKSLFMLQKSQLEFEQTLVMNQANWLAQEMSAHAEAMGGTDADLDNDPYYISLQKQEEYLTTRQDALSNQITLLTEEINSTKSLVQNNIKASCGLNLIGG
ncbi:hypothetical protein J6A31_03345 [bacterium]|nr:hypothetical protein [bacterium]